LGRKEVDVEELMGVFKLKVCNMFMHKISMDCIMEKKMFTFKAKMSLENKIAAT
jgi:hypothetical protein